jgi:hypothetical protein
MMHISSPTARQAIGWTLRPATAAALAVDAYVHADLVNHYAANKSAGTLSQGDLFHIEAGAASLGALLIILKGWRQCWAFAALVAGSALAAITISANYDIGAIGPIPDMYEPLWYPEKQLTAWAEAIAVALAVVGFILAPKLSGRPTARRSKHDEESVDTSIRSRV